MGRSACWIAELVRDRFLACHFKQLTTAARRLFGSDEAWVSSR